MAKMNITPISELVDETWGPIGTPERDQMEAELKAEVQAYHLGKAIREARQAQHLTQNQLGERLGVQKAQISRLEQGKSVITIPTMSRVFKALGVQTAFLDLGTSGRIALW